jgi:hypothetical protein
VTPKIAPKPPAPERPNLPAPPPEAGTGLVCACGEVWFVAYIAMRDDYFVNVVVQPVCSSCGTPAPPQVVRTWSSPKVQ